MPPGWRGDPPLTEDDARRRIIDAAMRCIDRDQSLTRGLSDVADELGVTRQTVYRRFASAEDLLMAAGYAAADDYLYRLGVHLRGVNDPAAAVVEAIMFAVQRLPRERFLGALLLGNRSDTFLKNVASQKAIALSRLMLDRMDVDWAGFGFGDDQLDGLAEFGLRMIQSLVLQPGPRRTRTQLRRWLTDWVAPAVNARGIASSMPPEPL